MATETITQTKSTGHGLVHTQINYYLPPEGRLLPEDDKSLIRLITGDVHSDTRNVDVNDVRDATKTFNLDQNAFEFVKHKSAKLDIDFYDEPTVQAQYYPEVEELVTRVLGAKRAQAFQHVYRNAMPVGPNTARLGKEAVKQGAAPLGRAHIDLSEAGSRTRLMMHTKDQEELEQVWEAGFMILSVWRPIQTVQRDPLCVMDRQTLPAGDMIKFSHPITYQGGKIPLERVTIKADEQGHPGKHEWYYCSQQTNEDVLLIKFCDSRKGHDMIGCPHTSFVVPDTEDKPARESIETRVMVFF